MVKVVAAIFALFFCSWAKAGDWLYLRPEAGIGFSDNVYQDDFNKKSDTFFWLAGAAKYDSDGVLWAPKLNLHLYSKENLNNYAAYSIKRVTQVSSLKSDLSLVAGGFQYLQKDVGSTDESYNNYYLSAFLTRTLKEAANFSLYAEPGVKVTAYPDLDRRTDGLIYFALNSVWRTRPTTEISPYGELGFNFSSQGYYSKNYIDLGVTWSEKLSPSDKFSADYFMRNSIYVNRKVSDILYIPNRSGRATGKSFETRETTGLRQLTASITHTMGNLDLTVGMSHASESSSSDLEHYEENQIYASVLWSL